MLTPALQFAISLIFVYLLLSALSSAIQEIVANLAKWRANTLEAGIENLLHDPNLTKKIYDHELLRGIWRPSWLFKKVETMHKPAYISSTLFAQVLQDVRTTPGTTLAPETQKLLAAVLKGATSADEEKKKIEKWFDDAMDSVSGWYKRKANAWLWVIAACVCVALNADTIAVGKVLWNDPTARAAISDAAKDYATKKANQPQDPSTGTTQQHNEPMATELTKVKQAQNQLNDLPVPLGWCKAGADECAQARQLPWGQDGTAWDASDWLLKFLGILISVLAVSQGAPFWFDLLQKVVNLRLAGDLPPDSRTQK